MTKTLRSKTGDRSPPIVILSEAKDLDVPEILRFAQDDGRRNTRFIDRLSVLAVSLAAALATTANARPSELKTKLLQACRQDVAGAYLEAYDEKERTIDYAKAITEQVASLDQALKTARAVHARAKAQADQNTFDADRAFAVDQAASIVRGLEGQRDESSRAEKAATGKVAELISAETTLRKKVEAVFALTRTGDKVDGGYPFKIDYRAPCPKYRHVCALPTPDADRLAKLEIRGVVPVACRRYATMRGRTQ